MYIMPRFLMMLSREVRRVPLEFDWPMNKVWKGYLNPYYRKCPHCISGYTPARIRLQELCHVLSIAGDDCNKGMNHPWSQDVAHHHPEAIPSNDIHELLRGLSGGDEQFLGGYNRWNIEHKIIEAAGLDPETWGICPHCNGSNIDPEIRESYESWEDYDPPEGDGYQLWEVISEGSPASPVFETMEDLLDWLGSFDGKGITKNFTREDWKAALGSACPTVDIESDELALPPDDR